MPVELMNESRMFSGPKPINKNPVLSVYIINRDSINIYNSIKNKKVESNVIKEVQILHTENWKILLKNSSVNLDRNHYI